MSKVTRFADPLSLAKAAADLIINMSGESILRSGKFTIALSGGKTPAILYELLASDDYCSRVDWKNIFIFWGDERCVPATGNDNNSYAAKQLLLNNIPIPHENIFPVDTTLPPPEAAAQYEETLKQFFRSNLPEFDLILLGMGDNGHTASLFPNSSVLQEKSSIVKEVFVREVNMWRITFTEKLINHAANKLFLVAGKDKATMLHTVLEGPHAPALYPAQMIRNADWFICT